MSIGLCPSGSQKLGTIFVSVDQDRYTSSVVSKYQDTSRTKENSKFHKTTLPHDMIFTKEYASISDKKVEVFFR